MNRLLNRFYELLVGIWDERFHPDFYVEIAINR
jgi:hypothetical protein